MTAPEVSSARASLNLEERDELVMRRLPEVHFIARRIHERLPVFVPLEDLVHSGVLGLLEATEKYDSTKNVQFKTFAQFRIRGAILDSLRELDRASRRLRTKSRRLNTAAEQLSMRLGRQPMEEEIAHEVGLDLAALRKLATTLRGLESVDRQVKSGEDRSETRDLIESAPADSKESPLAQCLRSEMKQQLAQAMSGAETYPENYAVMKRLPLSFRTKCSPQTGSPVSYIRHRIAPETSRSKRRFPIDQLSGRCWVREKAQQLAT